jgi:arylsulfatase A-like enzyme
MVFRNIIRFLVGLFLGLVSVKSSFADVPSRPNVIVVMTDDQGYGEFSCHGNPLAETPHIDRLASQSVRLRDFHVSPMCTPTRGQLMTGLDAFRNGAINVSSGRTLLRPELPTVANRFADAGYRTGIFGKWHLGDNYPFRPQDRGFQEALWFPSSHVNSVPDFWDNDYFDDTYLRLGQREKIPGYCTDVFFDEAIKWMKADAGKEPFFAYIPLNAAHWPWFAPDEARSRVQKKVDARPEVTQHLNPIQRRNLVSFLAMGERIDDNVGKLDAYLRESGLFDHTIVVFLTDNGSTMGANYYNAGMRGNKTTLWEGGHRVPCFIRWPQGLMGKSRDIDDLTQVQDLLPTLLDLAAVPPSSTPLDGTSLAPLLRGEVDSLPDRMVVINYSRMPQFKVTYTHGNPAIPVREGAAVLWKRWRLLEDRQLYDLETDPHQDRDVASLHPEVVSKMRDHLNAWWDGVKDKVLEPQRVILGSENENPTMLTACEWLDVFVDQQVQIRRGIRRNGRWCLTVAESGTYEFELRRWPRESGLKLAEGCPATQVTDGQYAEGQALPISQARLQVGQVSKTAPAQPDGESVKFVVVLQTGETQLQTWMLSAENDELCGAYYVYVTRQ